MPIKSYFFVAVICCTSVYYGFCQTPAKHLNYGSQYDGKRPDAAMQRFRDNRFGQFIHWGLYSVAAGEWNGKIYAGAAEWLPSMAKIPTASWDSLQYRFNPVNFNPREWAALAKQTGFKYLTITTKHHEGFCLWDSQYTDFDVAATPYKKDILKQLVEAYNAEGIDVYFYYSILDWHHPDWRYDIKSPEDSVAFARYFAFAQNQLLELQRRYPTVKGFWFDGTWDESWKKNGKYSYDIEMALKAVNPDVIVNSRLRADDLGSRHFDSNGDLMGDYQSGYERFLPEKNDTTIVKMDWETCMTIPENQWGYHKDWRLSHIKSANEILELLVKTVSLGGNFLLNYGPDANGNIRTEEVAISQDIGAWMEKNGYVIYQGDYAGMKLQDWGYYIKNAKTNQLFGVITNFPISGQMRVELPQKQKLNKATLNGQLLVISHHDKLGYFVELPLQLPPAPLVVTLEIE